MTPLRIALCGNPNVGKSTVFNALTGLKQHTGNWAGKTVDVSAGEVRDGEVVWQLIDLPGAYSLINGSAEEMAASDFLTFADVDAIIVVCDAICLERNLNLALQVASFCPRTVLCINMLDEAQKKGISIQLDVLEEQLAIPVVGICARKKSGLEELKKRVLETALSKAEAPLHSLIPYPAALSEELESVSHCIDECCPSLRSAGSQRLAALRALTGKEQFVNALVEKTAEASRLRDVAFASRRALMRKGYPQENLIASLTSSSYEKARELCAEAVQKAQIPAGFTWSLDNWLCRKWVAIPLGIGMLAAILYITILGANIPSQWLSDCFNAFLPYLQHTFAAWHLPAWFTGFFIDGIYRVTAWVISVMLPPMAIFFPLFTLLEDMGVLPRIAFHLDRCFQGCKACGKQALCMCMGLGCNAVGVTGCRIIQSPRERLIAILTNAMVPCNGRFPTLIALISMFLAVGSGLLQSLWGAAALTVLILLSIAVTLGSSFLLSKTILRGLPSAFTLELPPFRAPQLKEVLVRSVLDRTLFVLGRAVSVAAPAGALVWCLAHWQIQGESFLQFLSGFLNPLGLFLGMDGVILLAFILGFPANEIVLPLMLMIYLDNRVLMELHGFETLHTVLLENGWTVWTAIRVALFSLFHWPCSTTTLTIYKETRSASWTLLGFLLPTAVGCVVCIFVTFIQAALF